MGWSVRGQGRRGGVGGGEEKGPEKDMGVLFPEAGNIEAF